MTPTDALELIRNNNEGIFVAEDNKIFFESKRMPILNQGVQQVYTEYPRQAPQQVRSNPGSRMGDLLNQMCGLK
ncbi:MAG: hypothetical protein EOL97_07095 [Spirochaetia bacterium]|nr:hypothetical protein [Spirochaetia bacterium]